MYDKYPFRALQVKTFNHAGTTSFSFDPGLLLNDPKVESMIEMKRIDSDAAYLIAKELYKLKEEIIQIIKKELNS
jgi:hypothetical protein